MPVPLTAPTAQRNMQSQRARMRRRVPGSAAAEGTRSSGDSEGKYEECEVAVLVSNNRFAVLRPKEPAPGVQERQSALPLSPSLRREGPATVPLQTDIPPVVQPSSSGKTKGTILAPASSLTHTAKRPSIARPKHFTPMKSNQQPSFLIAASILPAKPQIQPSPLALQTDGQSARSPRTSVTPPLISSNFITAAPYPSVQPSNPAPSLPSPPISPDPMSIPCLATLPIPPSLNFNYLTNPKASGPKAPQFESPLPTSVDDFCSGDGMRHVVSTRSGKIFWMAAEIAAANKQSTMRPVGNVLVPGHALKFGGVKEKMDRRKLDRTCGDYVQSREDSEDESGDGETEEEGWEGKEEGFWKGPLLEERPVRTRTRTQTRKEGS